MPLTDLKIRQARPSEKLVKLPDGGGLYLFVHPGGSKLWRYRYKIGGRENMFALGEYPALSLVEARRARDAARDLVRLGRHPSHERRIALSSQVAENANTFGAVAEEWIALRRGAWSAYYLSQVRRGMDKDVLPYIGRRPLRGISSADMLQVLNRISSRGAKTVAINVRQWCGAVFRYGVATLRADADPLVALRGAVVRGEVTHAEAMSRDDLARFVAALQGFGGMRTTLLALRLLLYTFVRTVEMRRGEWAEVDAGSALWVIPAGKMKMGRTHVVPLSRQALEVLAELRALTGGGPLMFPNSRRPREPMSATTVNRALEYLGLPFSGHDFRATASTHLHEMGFASALVEMQLAHAQRNKTAASYNHAQYLPERRAMMQAWADWIDSIGK